MRYNTIKADIVFVYIKSSGLHASFSANEIQKKLKLAGLGMRRKTLLSLLRRINGTENNGSATLLYTPIKYLTSQQKEKKHELLYDKMKDEEFRRNEIEKRKAVRMFMKTNGYEEDRELIPSEKIEDAWNEMRRYVTCEREMR